MSTSAPAPELRLDFCTFDAARHAVLTWHYSHAMPSGKLVRIGVWEGGEFVGVVIFGRGANNNIGKPYGLAQTEVCELVRVALREHHAPVTRIVSIALRLLRKHSPGLRVVVSYADPERHHRGGIYQAGNWIYSGASVAQPEVIIDGKIVHKRTANAVYGTIKGLPKSPILWKHKYLMPLDDAMRESLRAHARPYPKHYAAKA
jgi:hypothetical protein